MRRWHPAAGSDDSPQMFRLSIHLRDGLPPELETWVLSTLRAAGIRLQWMRQPFGADPGALVLYVQASNVDRRHLGQLVRQLTFHPGVQAVRCEVDPAFRRNLRSH